MTVNIDFNALVRALREQLPHLSAVYVFGSRAADQAQAGSDLDLAVLMDGAVDSVQLWTLAQDIAVMVGCDVDLLDLRAASTVMQYQVITTGRRLWAADCQAGVYESFILSEKTALDTARAGLLADIRRVGRVYGR